MPLSLAERKHLMPHGAQREIAGRLKLAESYVSAVVTGDARPKTARARKTVLRVQTAVARTLGLPVNEVFPPELSQANQDAAPLRAAS